MFDAILKENQTQYGMTVKEANHDFSNTTDTFLSLPAQYLF